MYNRNAIVRYNRHAIVRYPISIISHQSIIPPHTPDYTETFQKIELPKRDEFDLKITQVTVSVDTTGLYNITSDNKLVANIGSSHADYIVEAGYYSLETLQEMIPIIEIDEHNYNNFACQVNFENAMDLKVILGYKNNIVSGRADYPVDITRGRNVIEVFSAVMEQSVNKEASTLVDAFIYQTIGLYNTVTFDNLSIPVDDYNTIDRIHYVIKDRNNELLDIPVPIYISFIISVM